MRRKTTVETEGHRLLRARADKLGHAVVAKELGTTQPTISRIARVENRPRGDLVGACYAAYGWNPLVWLTEAELHSTTIRRTAESVKRRGRSVRGSRKAAA